MSKTTAGCCFSIIIVVCFLQSQEACASIMTVLTLMKEVANLTSPCIDDGMSRPEYLSIRHEMG
jgi:hypothetical protein